MRDRLVLRLCSSCRFQRTTLNMRFCWDWWDWRILILLHFLLVGLWDHKLELVRSIFVRFLWIVIRYVFNKVTQNLEKICKSFWTASGKVLRSGKKGWDCCVRAIWSTSCMDSIVFSNWVSSTSVLAFVSTSTLGSYAICSFICKLGDTVFSIKFSFGFCSPKTPLWVVGSKGLGSSGWAIAWFRVRGLRFVGGCCFTLSPKDWTFFLYWGSLWLIVLHWVQKKGSFLYSMDTKNAYKTHAPPSLLPRGFQLNLHPPKALHNICLKALRLIESAKVIRVPTTASISNSVFGRQYSCGRS